MDIERAVSLAAVLDGAASRFPKKALHFPADRRTLSYEELRSAAGALSGGLAEVGVAAGDRVGILLPTGADFVVAFFGLLLRGAVPTPLSLPVSLGGLSAYAERLERIVRDGGITRLITDADYRPLLAERMPKLGLFTASELASSGAPSSAAPSRGSGLALVQYTSGSTADPKGVTLSHDCVLACLRAIIAGAGLTHDDVNGQWLPLYHDMGLIGLLGGIALGMDHHLSPPAAFVRDPSRWLRGFSAAGATIFAGPNFAYAYMLDNVPEEELARLDLSRWRVAFNGAEPISPSSIARFQAFFGRAGFRPQTMFPVYGLAEATLAVSFPPLGRPPRVAWLDREALANERRAVLVAPEDPRAKGVVSVGSAVSGMSLRIVGDRDGRPVLPEAEVGEVEVRGPSVMLGYYGRPEETRRTLDEGWLKTGDLGVLLDGELYITGRLKEVIIVRGANHYPHDAEEVVRKLPGVHRAQAIAFGAGAAPNERIAVMAETREQEQAALEALAARIREELGVRLGLDALEIHLVRPRTLKRTSSGKYQRLLMKRELAEGQLADRVLLSQRPRDAKTSQEGRDS